MDLDSQHQGAKAWIVKLQPSQIVCLELGATCLYAEVIQIIETRRLCWARPLILAVDSLGTEDFSQSSEHHFERSCHDLRQGSDLLLPAILFRQALDVEAIPLLSSLYKLDTIAHSEPNAIVARRQLNEFVRQICQAHPDVFSDRDGLDRP